jgi:DNA repair exonuclease SbcCD ATPase subunit
MKLNKIFEILENALVSSALRERLAIVKEALTEATNKVARLEAENAELKEQVAEALQQLEDQKTESEFVEHRGAKFKREALTGKFDGPYCPACLKPFTAAPGNSFFCIGCKSQPTFKKHDLNKILSRLNKPTSL